MPRHNKVVVDNDWSSEKKKLYRSKVRQRRSAARKKRVAQTRVCSLGLRVDELDNDIWQMEDEKEQTQEWASDCSTELMEEDRYAPDARDMDALRTLMSMQAKQEEDIGIVEIQHTPEGNVVIKTEKKIDLEAYEPMIGPVMFKMGLDKLDDPSKYDLNEKIKK